MLLYASTMLNAEVSYRVNISEGYDIGALMETRPLICYPSLFPPNYQV